jgi:hypothetical protein
VNHGQMAGDSRGRLDRSAMSFIEAYAPRHFFVVNSREHPDTKVGKTRAYFVKPHQYRIGCNWARARSSATNGGPQTAQRIGLLPEPRAGTPSRTENTEQTPHRTQ